MRICAVDLKNNEANICLMELNQGLINVPDCRAKKFTLLDASSTEQIRSFRKQFTKLIDDYKIDAVVIRERPTHGKFAGSAISFKLEACLQLIDNIECEVLKNSDVKEIIKRSPLQVTPKEVGLKQFQEHALITAFAYLSR